jgi:nitric oxide dioxygenase
MMFAETEVLGTQRGNHLRQSGPWPAYLRGEYHNPAPARPSNGQKTVRRIGDTTSSAALAALDVLGDAATDEIIAAWAEAYGLLANIFIDRERQIYDGQAAQQGGWTGYRPFVVQRKQRESEIVTSFYLVPQDGGELPAFKPGQYITVRVDQPPTPTAPRNYSLSDRPGTPYFRISVKREAGLSADAPAGVISNHLHDNVQVGDVLAVGPPCGEFTLDANAIERRPIVLISGGIGITPLLAMAKDLAHRGWREPVHIIHAARSSRGDALSGEARHLADLFSNFQVHVRYDEPLADDLSRGCCNSVGQVDAAMLREIMPRHDAEFYVCGPAPFMASVDRILRSQEIPDSQIHMEFFGPKQDLASLAAAHRDGSRGASQPALI